MAENNVTVDPRFMKYDKVDVERILDKVENDLVPASEESVRSIVSNYTLDGGSSDSGSND